MTIDPIIIKGYGPDSDTGTVMRKGYVTSVDIGLLTVTFTIDALAGLVEVDGIEIDVTFTLANTKIFTVDTNLVSGEAVTTPKGKPRTLIRAPVVIPVSVDFSIYAEAWIEIENPIMVEAITSHEIFEPVGITAEAFTPVETSGYILGTAFADTDSMFSTSANTYNVVDSTIQVEADNYNMVEIASNVHAHNYNMVEIASNIRADNFNMIEITSNIQADTYVNVVEAMAITGIASQELDTNLTVMGTKNIDEILLLLDDDLWLLSQAENLTV